MSQVWAPTVAEGALLGQEGRLVADFLADKGLPEGGEVFVAGQASRMQGLPGLVNGERAAVARVRALAAAGALVGGAAVPLGSRGLTRRDGAGVEARPVVAGGLGFPEAVVPAGNPGMDELRVALEETRTDLDRKHRANDQEQEKREKDKEKKKKRDRSRGRRRRRGGSSSSGDHSDGSSSEGDRVLRWRSDEKVRKISPTSARRVSTRKFKARGDLCSYAEKNPGALSGHFLITIFERLYNHIPADTRELRRASVVSWAQKYGGLSEVRDQREVQTLAYCMDSLQRKEIEIVVDVMAKHIIAIQQAKSKGGSWEKAQKLELVAPDGAGAMPSGMARLLA